MQVPQAHPDRATPQEHISQRQRSHETLLGSQKGEVSMRNPEAWTDAWQPSDPLYLPGIYQIELFMIKEKEECHIDLGQQAARWTPITGWLGKW